MSIGIPRGDVMTSQLPCRVGDLFRDVDARVRNPYDEALQIVSPRTPAEAVKQPLDRELSALLGEEASPVVVGRCGLTPGGAQGPVALLTPALELRFV